jgi:hypothetical protein
MSWKNIDEMTMALVIAQDRNGARSLTDLLTEVGRPDPTYQAAIATASSMSAATLVDVGNPTQMQALASAMAKQEGEPLSSLDVPAGLRMVGIYQRMIVPVAPRKRR